MVGSVCCLTIHISVPKVIIILDFIHLIEESFHVRKKTKVSSLFLQCFFLKLWFFKYNIWLLNNTLYLCVSKKTTLSWKTNWKPNINTAILYEIVRHVFFVLILYGICSLGWSDSLGLQCSGSDSKLQHPNRQNPKYFWFSLRFRFVAHFLKFLFSNRKSWTFAVVLAFVLKVSK
jgi:hypothetical protein